MYVTTVLNFDMADNTYLYLYIIVTTVISVIVENIPGVMIPTSENHEIAPVIVNPLHDN